MLRDLAGLEAAIDLALLSDDEVLLERFVDGREYTVGVLGDEALTVGEIVPRHEIFDYECKYTPGMSEEIFPARIDAALTETLRALALRTHRALKLRDFSRVDFRVDRAGPAVVPGGEHAAGHDRDQPAAAVRRRGRHPVRRAVRSDVPHGASRAAHVPRAPSASQRGAGRPTETPSNGAARGCRRPRSAAAAPARRR